MDARYLKARPEVAWAMPNAYPGIENIIFNKQHGKFIFLTKAVF